MKYLILTIIYALLLHLISSLSAVSLIIVGFILALVTVAIFSLIFDNVSISRHGSISNNNLLWKFQINSKNK